MMVPEKNDFGTFGQQDSAGLENCKMQKDQLFKTQS